MTWKGYAESPVVYKYYGYAGAPYLRMNNSFDFLNTPNRFILTNLEIDTFVYLKSIDIYSNGGGEVELSVWKKFYLYNSYACKAEMKTKE